MVGVAISMGYEHSFVLSLLLTVGGGMFGIWFFSSVGKHLKKWLANRKKNKAENSETPQGIKINKQKRLIVRIKQKYGLVGIAFLTPCILTVPVGAVAAGMLFRNKAKMYAYMLVSFIFWSLVFFLPYHALDLDIKAMLPF